jgi:hypothetical protein
MVLPALCFDDGSNRAISCQSICFWRWSLPSMMFLGIVQNRIVARFRCTFALIKGGKGVIKNLGTCLCFGDVAVKDDSFPPLILVSLLFLDNDRMSLVWLSLSLFTGTSPSGHPPKYVIWHSSQVDHSLPAVVLLETQIAIACSAQPGV